MITAKAGDTVIIGFTHADMRKLEGGDVSVHDLAKIDNHMLTSQVVVVCGSDQQDLEDQVQRLVGTAQIVHVTNPVGNA